LGEVPASWTVQRLKTHLQRNDGGVWGDDFDPEGTIVLRSTEQTVGGDWKIDDPAVRALSARDRVAAVLAEGDLVITKSSGSELHIGKTSIVTREVAALGCCFSNFMQRLRCDRRTAPRFVHYILNSPIGREQMVYGSNTTTGLANLNGGVIGNIVVGWPPLPEQEAIAAWLDERTRRIDELVAAKRRLVGLLAEQRTALISHAVTKGLDPAAHMKPSGIGWLGDVPRHWEVKRLRFSLRSIEQGWSPQCEARLIEGDDEWGVLKVGCVNGTVFDDSEHKALPADLDPLPEFEIKPGDVLMSRANTRQLLGSSAFVHAVRPRLLLCDKLYRIRTDPKQIDPRFLVLAFRGYACRFQFEREADGASGSMKNIGQDTIKNVWMLLPPLGEQRAIVAHLDAVGASLDSLTAAAGTAITCLTEYRQALVSDMVTGQIKASSENDHMSPSANATAVVPQGNFVLPSGQGVQA